MDCMTTNSTEPHHLYWNLEEDMLEKHIESRQYSSLYA